MLDTNGLWLTPPPMLSITVLDSTNPAAAHLSFTGVPGAYYSVQVSSNLLHWETLGAGVEAAGGQFEFSDAGNALTRFYRVRVP